jgi:alpha 1,6-mannosyltransferase
MSLRMRVPPSTAGLFAQGRSLVRGFFALPPVRRLGVSGFAGIAFFITLVVCYTIFHEDPRFHNRVFTRIEPDAEMLGIQRPEDFHHHVRVGASHIPPNIWQIAPKLPPGAIQKAKGRKIRPGSKAEWMEGWRRMNPGYHYQMIRDDDMSAFVLDHVRDDTTLQTVMMAPGNPGIKSDLMRYLLLYFEGGVYTDMDTISLRPIKDWIPEKYRDQARVVIGVEFDRLDGENWRGVHHDMQFCQWTIAAAPGHRVFVSMLARAITYLEEHQRRSTWLGGQRPWTIEDILTTTGPAAWTDAVFQELRQMDPEIKTLRDLSGLTEERLIGDILILPIDGFGMGQRHSNSTRNKPPPPNANAKHQFHGTWRDK